MSSGGEVHKHGSMWAFLQRVGAPMAEVAQTFMELLTLSGQTFISVARYRVDRRELVRQLYDMGNRSLLFIGVTLGVLGVISIYQGATQVERVLPEFSRVGASFLTILVREFGPTICGLMVATRTGSSIAAQVGSMMVTEQIDALRMCNTDPVRYLLVPRFLAAGPMVLLLTIFGIGVAFFSGMVTARIGWEIPYATFVNTSMVKWNDVGMCAVKSLSYGYSIPIIATHAGLGAHGGSEGVGSATTRSVVNCCFAVIILDFIVSGVTYVAVMR